MNKNRRLPEAICLASGMLRLCMRAAHLIAFHAAKLPIRSNSCVLRITLEPPLRHKHVMLAVSATRGQSVSTFSISRESSLGPREHLEAWSLVTDLLGQWPSVGHDVF